MAQVTVNALPTPTINNSSSSNDVCADDMVMLTGLGGQTYVWSGTADPQLYQGQSIIISPNVSDVYTVTATDQNGCAGMTSIGLNVSACTGLEKQNTSLNFNVMPNPTSGKIKIEFTSVDDRQLSISDLSGRLLSKTISVQQQEELDLSNLSNGIYYLTVDSKDGKKVMKVVKD